MAEQKKALRTLYPPFEPYAKGFLKVDDEHEIYWEESGNPEGKPVVVLHGGPGGGSVPFYRQYFDPKAWRIVMFDQRGAGQSTPHASLNNNTTWHLVDDIERIRQHVKGIDKWTVFGGSWGSTLSLAYAITHPDKVDALILRGIFMLRREELVWFYQSGASFVYSDAWDKYLQPIPLVERHDMMSAYYRRLTGQDKKVQMEAAKAWSGWEMATSHLEMDPESIARGEDDHFAIAFARIESHYFVHGGFFETDAWILENADKIKNIPGVIVHGRYDMVCPFKSAWDLKKAWPKAELKITHAGHAGNEVENVHELVSATDAFKASK